MPPYADDFDGAITCHCHDVYATHAAVSMARERRYLLLLSPFSPCHADADAAIAATPRFRRCFSLLPPLLSAAIAYAAMIRHCRFSPVICISARHLMLRWLPCYAFSMHALSCLRLSIFRFSPPPCDNIFVIFFFRRQLLYNAGAAERARQPMFFLPFAYC